MLGRKNVEDGNRLPGWWYGLAYYDINFDYRVCYPLPLNYLVRAGLWLRWQWYRFVYRGPKWYDQLVADKNRIKFAKSRGYERGYLKGRQEGYDLGRQKVHTELAEAVDELKSIRNELSRKVRV